MSNGSKVTAPISLIVILLATLTGCQTANQIKPVIEPSSAIVKVTPAQREQDKQDKVAEDKASARRLAKMKANSDAQKQRVDDRRKYEKSMQELADTYYKDALKEIAKESYSKKPIKANFYDFSIYNWVKLVICKEWAKERYMLTYQDHLKSFGIQLQSHKAWSASRNKKSLEAQWNAHNRIKSDLLEFKHGSDLNRMCGTFSWAVMSDY